MRRALDVLLTAGAEDIQGFRLVGLDDDEAELNAAIRFYDGSRLGVRLVARICDNTPMVLLYSFHYMTDADATIFRYDNADHHQGLENSPHHKHIGEDETVIGCEQPSVGQVRNEIMAHLERIE